MTNIKSTSQKSFELKKHVAVIHSSNSLSLVQRKIANILLYNAYNDLLNKEVHEINLVKLCEYIGYNSKAYKQIKLALTGLMRTVIEWNLIDKESLSEEEWGATTLLSDVRIRKHLCQYSYSPSMRQLLHRPDVYGKLNIKAIAQFTSSYGLALYENCIRYQNIGKTRWIEMSTFRKLMGVDEGKYKEFKDLRKRVIDKAISEVNLYGFITVSVQFKKDSNQVIALKFNVSKLGSSPSDITDSLPSLAEKVISEFGFTKNKVDEIFSKYSESYIQEKISIIESSTSYKNGKIANLAKYLESALMQDYKLPKSSAKRIELTEERVKEQKKIKEKLLPEYRAYMDREIIKRYGLLQNKDQKQIDREFEKYIKGTCFSELFAREGLNNVLIVDRFCDYVRTNKKGLLDGLMDFNQYSEINTKVQGG